ncbi:MAG TPA: M48 family metalloprotease, partial [Vicinamibacterales bacterium]|nr:M48 family metalloprotease [Vicinamibacterales bacterium]
MRRPAFALALLMLATPSYAQFGALNKALEKAQKIQKLSDLKISDQEERETGQQVSDRIVNEFGVYQDAGVTKYVSLVGIVLAQVSSRPDLDWQFVVLDTDGVNAFAAPGGFVHITRGLLGLIKNEAELAGVLGHEIVHITEKHTVNAIQKSDSVKFASDEVSAAGGMTQSLVTRLAGRVYDDVLNNKFSRDDEKESDEKGVELANRVGYAPAGLTSVLAKLADRNKDAKEPNGLFASHPLIKERIANIQKTIRDRRLTATALVEARYTEMVAWDAAPVSAVATVAPGARGLAGGDEKTDDKSEDKKDGDKEAAKPEPASKPSSLGGVLGRLRPGGGTQAQQTQTVASAGARGVNPDRDAVGGPNRTRVSVKIGPDEIAEFKKGIA